MSSDLSLISDWGRENLVVFNAMTQFLHLSTRQNLPDVYPLAFNNTQINPSPSLNILGVSFLSNHSRKTHIRSLAKTDSMKLGVLYRLRGFFSTTQLLALYRGLTRPRMEYSSHVCVWGVGGSPSTSLLDRVESKAFRLINSRPLTNSLQPLFLHRNVASLYLFYR